MPVVESDHELAALIEGEEDEIAQLLCENVDEHAWDMFELGRLFEKIFAANYEKETRGALMKRGGIEDKLRNIIRKDKDLAARFKEFRANHPHVHEWTKEAIEADFGEQQNPPKGPDWFRKRMQRHEERLRSLGQEPGNETEESQ
jgi:hypothetical protein